MVCPNLTTTARPPSCHPERSAAGAKSKDLAAVEDRAAAIERAHLEAPAIGWREAAIGAAIGLFAGLASGYVGVGGGFIMVPLMLSLVGISMKQASGTSLIAVMLLAIPGTIEQGLLGNIDYMAGIAVAVGSIPGAVIGASCGSCPSARCASSSADSSSWPRSCSC